MYKNIAIVILLLIVFGLYAEGRSVVQENAYYQYSINKIAAFNQEYFTKHNLDWNDYLSAIQQTMSDNKHSFNPLERYYNSCQSNPLKSTSADANVNEDKGR